MHQKPRQLSLHLAALKDNVKAVAYFVQRRGMFVDAFATELVITSLPAACISALDEFAAGVTWFVELYGEAKKHRCESLQVIINNETDTALKPGSPRGGGSSELDSGKECPQSFILILEFVDKENMTQVLGRISAFSEGKVGKGKKSEAAAGETSKGYFGHNFPLTVLEDFVQVHGGGGEGGKERGCGDGLTDGERDLLGICRKQGLMGKGEGKGGGGGGGSKKGGGGRGRCLAASAYLIAYLKNDYATKQHELRHARFFLDEGYRSACLEAWARLSEKQKKYVSSFLSRLGYHEDVHVDEFQAFHLTEKANFWGIKVDVAWPASVVEGE
ncbi:Hypothetical protein NocV09_02400380 [Nannochloropsis oceanica]